jgi:hypothetical protein
MGARVSCAVPEPSTPRALRCAGNHSGGSGHERHARQADRGEGERLRCARDADKKLLGDVKRRTETQQRRYRDRYKTAEEVRTNFLRDRSSKLTQKVHAALRRLGLPALPDLKDEFRERCDDLGVGPAYRAA